MTKERKCVGCGDKTEARLHRCDDNELRCDKCRLARALDRCPVKETDLRSITRDSDRLICDVRIDMGWSKDAGTELKFTWLRAGEAQLRSQRDRADGRWRLEAHLGGSACDFEHDTAWAFRLPLIGLQLGAHDFCVPRPGYNPVADPGTKTCNGKKNCRWGDGKPHPIVPEGLYVPPFDAALYEAVREKRVEIVIGPVFVDKD